MRPPRQSDSSLTTVADPLLINMQSRCYHTAAMDPQEELQQLLARQETLRQDLKARKKELQAAQRRQRSNLQKQIRRAQARLSAAERKRRTRRLIVLGSLMEKQHGHPELIALLDQALDRDQDRALFDLPPKGTAGDDRPAAAAAAPLEGWRPTRLADGSWGSLYAGTAPQALPPDLVGLTISVRARSGKSWNATITEVLERKPARVLVRSRRTRGEPAESRKTS